MAKHVVAQDGDISEGERISVQLEGREVTVFNIEGNYYAYTNWCAHQSGPICEGTLTGTRTAEVDEESRTLKVEWTKEGQILSCPWHGWEYDVVSGECLSQRGVKLPPHPVEVKDGEIIVSL